MRRAGRPQPFPIWALVVAIVALLTACGSDGESTSGQGVLDSKAVEDADGAEDLEGTDDGGVETSAPADSSTIDDEASEVIGDGAVADAVAAYDNFLVIRDVAYMTPDSDLSALEALANEPVVEEVTDFWARNEAFQSADVGVLERSSASNVIDTQVSGGAVVISDCLEMREEHQDQLGSPVRFIEQDATLIPTDAGWVVDSIQVLRSGDAAQPDWFGCVPNYHAERVTATVTQLAEALLEWQTSKEAVVPDDLYDSLSDALKADAERAVAAQNEEFSGRYFSSKEERLVTVAGSDVATGGWNFLVELCRYYPDGEIWTDLASGVEFERQPIDSATRIGYRVLSVEQPDGSWTDEIVDLTPIESPSPCWEESR